MNSSTSETLFTLIGQLYLLDLEMDSINDHGEFTGFCQQNEFINRRFENSIDELLQEVDALRRRLRKYKEQEFSHEST